jgi:hypothetical protein
MKKEERKSVPFIIQTSDLPNQIYDMIGLVDSCSISTQGSNSVDIRVQGRDLMKVLHEDGSYFIPISYVNKPGENTYFMNYTPDKDKFIKRNFISGDYKDVLYANVFRGLEFSLLFMVNICQSIGIVPDYLFSSYKDKRTMNYRGKVTEKQLTEEPASGVWGIIKLNIDKQLDDRRMADNSLSQPDGSIYQQFQKVCQEPLVEFWGDTYGDQYYLNVRKPPFDQDGILSYIKNTCTTKTTQDVVEKYVKEADSIMIEIDMSEVISDSLEFNESDIFTWFRIDSGMLNFSGNKDNILPFIPTCYFPLYVDIWGNKKFELSDAYISYRSIKEKSFGSIEYVDFFKQAIKDLMYCINIYSYMPFTRSGTCNKW